MTKYRLKDSHPVAQKVFRVYELMEDLGICVEVGDTGRMLLHVLDGDTIYEIEDIEGSDRPMAVFPPETEWKIVYEKEEEEAISESYYLTPAEVQGEDPEAKLRFHAEWKKRLLEIARDLGLRKGSYVIRANRAGPGSLGEVTLHSDVVYLEVGGTFWAAGMPEGEVLYRTCKGLKDYTGGPNQWLKLRDLVDDNFEGLRKLVADQKSQPIDPWSPPAYPAGTRYGLINRKNLEGDDG